ncbi:MAG: hypothetical protein K0U86_22510 [Planctomycetes bacterium]|nr:hypothetical protein [Planctomycetota bacterium]MCH9727682.1 hypothetical protein [Planctomycetota bacterium]MCH9775107.1 hypothetical protein [Planctomycetota bacterium]MCH9790245.1 hypothetical protein [Planctomycetota bacterium]MDF1745363.1 hypothetical protein [Gimesia sp.]
MWCTNCQSDVAAEVSADSKRVHCAICSNDLGTTAAARISDKTQEARELLARWSNREVLDPYGPLAKSELRPTSTSPLFDQSETHPLESMPQTFAEQERTSEEPAAYQTPVEESKQENTFQTDDNVTGTAHEELESVSFQETAVPQLHAEYNNIQTLIEEDDQSPNWLALVGQLMAYGGVAVLTIGTTLVLWGYYGGPANYASTGWLISTAGQMLLFLGVITLVSAGMEQATTSVSRRIDSLSQRIFLFEKALLDQQESQKQQSKVSQVPPSSAIAPERASRKSA